MNNELIFERCYKKNCLNRLEYYCIISNNNLKQSKMYFCKEHVPRYIDTKDVIEKYRRVKRYE